MSKEYFQQRARHHAERAGIDPAFYDRLVATESNWNPEAVNSRSGAAGLTQVMSATAAQPGYGITPLRNRYDHEDSLRFGADYVAALNKKYGGDMDKVAAAYNWGPGNVDKLGLDKAPEETRNYIAKVSRGEVKGSPLGRGQPTAVVAAPVQPQPLPEPGMARLAAESAASERAAAERAEAIASVIGSSTAPQEGPGMAAAAAAYTPVETTSLVPASAPTVVVGKPLRMPGSNKHRNIQQGLA